MLRRFARAARLSASLWKPATTDTHSGEVGGAARNPIAELMRLVCDLYDPITGTVMIKGFYDDVIPPTEAGAERLGQLRLHRQRLSRKRIT